jgi:hypothetical protein
MAKKKRRPRSRPPAGRSPAGGPPAAAPGSAPPRGPARGGANVDRRERKEEARRLREAERRRARRTAALRRTVTSIGIAVLAVGGIWVFQSLGGANEIPDTAIRAATRAGCTEVDQPASSAPSGQHLQPGQAHEYADTPATSGLHAQSWITEPQVFDTQPAETEAVHSMEHGAVFVYYLPEPDGGLPQDVVDRLAEVAEGSEATFLAPYPTLTGDTALTLTAWNRRQSCPAASPRSGEPLTADRAATIVNGFVTAFECTGNAPESNAPC